MSRARPDLKNSLEAARNFVKWLSSLPQVEAVYLSGSRSPLREKQPTQHSDWDLHVISQTPKLKLTDPKLSGFHADLAITNNPETLHTKAVMVWPEDEHGVLQWD